MCTRRPRKPIPPLPKYRKTADFVVPNVVPRGTCRTSTSTSGPGKNAGLWMEVETDKSTSRGPGRINPEPQAQASSPRNSSQSACKSLISGELESGEKVRTIAVLCRFGEDLQSSTSPLRHRASMRSAQMRAFVRRVNRAIAFVG